MINRFISVGLAALLAGCTVGPNFQPQVPPATDRYTMTGDDAIAGPIQARLSEQVLADWWTLFQSPELDAVMREALADNKTLAQARARLAAARDAQRTEGSLVQADLNAGAENERFNLSAFGFGGGSFGGLSFPTNPTFNLYSIGATISYNTDIFGGVRRRRESLAASTEAQAHELEAAYLTLTGQVVAQAISVAAGADDLNARQEVIASDRTNLDMLTKAFAAGGAMGVDVKAAESQLAQDEATIPIDQQAVAVSRHRLAVLVGKTPGEWTAPPFDDIAGHLPTALPVSLPSEMVHSRPDILEAEAQLHAATAQIGVETANLYPNITLNGSLTQQALDPSKLFSFGSTAWTAAAGLTAPLFHGGELKAKKRQAEDNARAALAAYQQTVLEAFDQVADALEAINHDNEVFAAQTRALDAAKIRLDMERNGFRAGGATGLSVVLAERDWTTLRVQNAQEGADRYSDAARLLLTTAAVPPGLANERADAGRKPHEP
jgi:NodT family efflux transporter outer membrane factor (OMF) lipoprotein